MRRIFFIVLAILCLNTLSAEKVQRAWVGENFENPLGLNLDNLTFSWMLPFREEGLSQSAYRVVVGTNPKKLFLFPDIWDSKKVESDQSNKIEYRGRYLESREKIYWSVKVWDDKKNEWDWSKIQTAEVGLLSNSDWTGIWIASNDALRERKIIRPQDNKEFIFKNVPATYFRKIFNLSSKKIEKARLYATAKGVYEMYINGERIGDDFLSPGWTEYSKRIQTTTYDVTDRLKNGLNNISSKLGEGWFGTYFTWTRESQYGERPYLLAQLEVLYEDGTKDIISTDETWKYSSGAILMNELYDGEDYDANFEHSDWNKVDFNDANWKTPRVENIEKTPFLEPRRNQIIKKMLEVSPKLVTDLGDGKFLIDMGQNMVGWARLINFPCEKDKKITIRVSEVLEKDKKTLYTRNYRAARSSDTYIPKENGFFTWEPTFTFHGFRYIEVSGLPKDSNIDKDNIKGIVIYNDMKKTGTFETSNEKINQLQSNILWGQRGNFISVPTDCPQRDERMGWTGDAQVFIPTSVFNMDVEAFFTKWAVDLADTQKPDGRVSVVAPCQLPDNEYGSPAWSDAVVICPWEIYLSYGNKKILKQNYEVMKKWVDYLIGQGRDLKGDKKGLLGVNRGHADWLLPMGNPVSKRFVSTFYFARVTDTFSKVAKVLGKNEDHKKYSKIAKGIKEVFRETFFDENGKINDKTKNEEDTESQTGYAMALSFNMIFDENFKRKVHSNLLKKIEKDGHSLNTGFLGTSLINKALSTYDIGKEESYRLLLNENYPSWIYTINNGATTMWERWNGYSEETGVFNHKMNSFNHYSFGSIGKWMYANIAGIEYDEENPGYKNIIFSPKISDKLSFVKASLETPYGIVKSQWRVNKGKVIWEIQIPSNAKGHVVFPTDKTSTVKMYRIVKNKKIPHVNINAIYENIKSDTLENLSKGDGIRLEKMKLNSISGLESGIYEISFEL